MMTLVQKTIDNVPKLGPKLGLIAEGVLVSIVGIGFAINSSAVTWLWPCPDHPMTGVLLAALLVSYGSGSIFVACTADWRGATSGGALALVVGFGGFALAISTSEYSGHATQVLPHAIVLGAIALVSACAVYAGQSSERSPTLPAPLLVRATLLVLALGLALMGYGLLAGWHGILPWHVDAPTAILVGWLFIGFAADYVLTALQGNRSACDVLLFGIVVYNSVMILPLLRGMAIASPDELASLTGNIIGMFATTLFSGYFLSRGYNQTWKWSNALSA